MGVLELSNCGENTKGRWDQQRDVLLSHHSSELNFRPLNPESEFRSHRHIHRSLGKGYRKIKKEII